MVIQMVRQSGSGQETEPSRFFTQRGYYLGIGNKVGGRLEEHGEGMVTQGEVTAGMCYQPCVGEAKRDLGPA